MQRFTGGSKQPQSSHGGSGKSPRPFSSSSPVFQCLVQATGGCCRGRLSSATHRAVPAARSAVNLPGTHREFRAPAPPCVRAPPRAWLESVSGGVEGPALSHGLSRRSGSELPWAGWSPKVGEWRSRAIPVGAAGGNNTGPGTPGRFRAPLHARSGGALGASREGSAPQSPTSNSPGLPHPSCYSIHGYCPPFRDPARPATPAKPRSHFPYSREAARGAEPPPRMSSCPPPPPDPRLRGTQEHKAKGNPIFQGKEKGFRLSVRAWESQSHEGLMCHRLGREREGIPAIMLLSLSRCC